MKLKYRNHRILFYNSFLVFIVSILASSCIKNDNLFTPDEGTSYMPQAYQDRGKISLLKVDSVQATTFGFYYTSFAGAPSDVTGEFSVDNSLIAKYNDLNAYTGNVYYPLPAGSYSLSNNSTVVKKGKTTSDPLSILINPKTLVLGKKYMIPIKLTRVSSGKIDSTLSITYFKIDDISIRSRDHTGEGALTSNYENTGNPNENSSKLVDNNFTTKFLAFNYQSDFYVQLSFPSKVKLDAYTLTSGNDAPERDPKDWNLQGSNDGTNWTTIDTHSGETFSGRLLTRTFNLANRAEYSFYRLNITAINGANLIQITEWRMLEYY
jgi:hypothetical protein